MTNRCNCIQVNDNICDCCDGSDEKESVRCQNKCHEKIEKLQAEFNLKNQALVAKQHYLIAGKSKNEQVNIQYIF